MKAWKGLIAAAFCVVVATPTLAIEIITKDDFVTNTIKKEQLVKVADNLILMLDTSSSTNDLYRDTGKPIIQVMKQELQSRNSYFPDLGHQVGIITYTGWTVNYPVALYDRAKVGAVFDAIPEKGKGPTNVKWALEQLEPTLKTLKGRTAVFLWWDGEYTGQDPVETAARLAKAYDVCAYVVSTATPKREAELMQNIPKLNNCSRTIPLADFLAHPEYISGALYDVKVTEHVVTTTEKKIVGAKLNMVNFTFDGTELDAEDKAKLDQLADFMKGRPKSRVVIAGYTDDVGTRDYNEGLSKQRATAVADYLKGKGIDGARIATLWYGLTNPIVPNDSDANRAKNRRVEVSVALGE